MTDRNEHMSFPGFESEDVVAGFFGDVWKGVKKAAKNPVVMAAIPVAAVPAAFATSKPKNALKSVTKGAQLSVSVATGAAALNLSKSNDPIGDAKKIVGALGNPAVKRALIATADIARSGNLDAKKTLKMVAATKAAIAKHPPAKPGLRQVKPAQTTSRGVKRTGVLVDSSGIVRRGTFYQ